MLTTISFIFGLGLLLGLTLLTYVLRHKNTPKGLAIIHGWIGFLGIILLLVYVLLYSPNPWVSLLTFVLAALGGFYLKFYDLTHRSLPILLALIHGLLAILGFVLLLTFIFRFT